MGDLTIAIFKNRIVCYIIIRLGITFLHSPSTISITHNRVLYRYDCMNYECILPCRICLKTYKKNKPNVQLHNALLFSVPELAKYIYIFVDNNNCACSVKFCDEIDQ